MALTWASMSGADFDADSIANETRMGQWQNNTALLYDGDWLGSRTRVKVMPTRFRSAVDVSANQSAASINYTNAITNRVNATQAVPENFTATAANIYGNSFVPYYHLNTIIDGTTATAIGVGSTPGTETDITDVEGDSENYITLRCQATPGNVYGAYLTIEAKSVPDYDSAFNPIYAPEVVAKRPLTSALMDKFRVALNDLYAGRGWLGSHTRIKVTPSEFVSSSRQTADFARIADTGTKVSSAVVGGVALCANAYIPHGYQATAVKVYGEVAAGHTFDVYECAVNSVTATSRGANQNVGSERTLSTEVAGADGVYLSIVTTNPAAARDVYGAYVTIERVP